MITVHCKICNIEFAITPSRLKNKNHTCSKECMGKLFSKLSSRKIETNCDICGKQIYYKLSAFKKRKHHTCSHECHAKLKSKIIHGKHNPNALNFTTEERFFWKKYLQLKNHSSLRKIEFNLSYEFLLSLFNKQSGLCYYTNYPLKIFGKKDFDTISVDRINSNKGYTEDNVVYCLNCINTMKSNSDINDIHKVFKFIAIKYKDLA